jgi:hypothetical protein
MLRSARVRLLIFAAAVFLASLAGARPAAAYTQFQFSTGTSRCSLCHFSPAGTGLINSWGRDEAGDTISRGGDGAFAHGLWAPPSWLALGLDFRLAAIRNDVGGPESPEYAAFPMQFDVYARAQYEAFSAYVDFGDRGIVRPADNTPIGRLEDIPNRIVSPNHYLMWRPNATGPYVRVGRFYTPYGLRFVEHIFYVQRYTGYNLYEQTYNVSGGYVEDDWEVHVSGFTPPPVGMPNLLAAVGVRESGGVVYAEKRFAGMASVALQTRIGVGPDSNRYQFGGLGKVWWELPRILFLGEGDYIRQDLKAAHFGQNQFVSYLGATSFPTRGLMVGLAYERFQEDLNVSTTGRNAYDIEVNFFPWAHWELILLARYQKAVDGPTPPLVNDSASLVMLQLHYYL